MLKKIKNNNKGAFTIWQRGFLYLILFCVFTFAIDICILGLEILTTSHQLAYAAEKLSFQGGFIGANPPNSNHWSNEDFYDYFNRSLVRFGVDGVNYHWSLYSNEDGADVRIVDTDSGSPINLSHVSSPRVGVNQISSNYAKDYVLTINFQHKYFFSGNVFKFSSPVNTYTLSQRYKCLYVNGR